MHAGFCVLPQDRKALGLCPHSERGHAAALGEFQDSQIHILLPSPQTHFISSTERQGFVPFVEGKQ